MSQINLIITCEECGEVIHQNSIDETKVDSLFKNFTCKNKCNRTFLSYITIGQIEMTPHHAMNKRVA